TGRNLQGRRDLWEMLRDLVADGTTLLLTTQYLEEADRLPHRVAVIDGGRVIAEGTPADLKGRLGNTVIEIGMPNESAAVRAADVLSSRVAGRPEREGSTVRIPSNEGARLLIEVLRSLDAEDLAPVSLAVREPSLDDVFLAL